MGKNTYFVICFYVVDGFETGKVIYVHFIILIQCIEELPKFELSLYEIRFLFRFDNEELVQSSSLIFFGMFLAGFLDVLNKIVIIRDRISF